MYLQDVTKMNIAVYCSKLKIFIMISYISQFSVISVYTVKNK